MKKILILFVVLFSLISVERLHTVEDTEQICELLLKNVDAMASGAEIIMDQRIFQVGNPIIYQAYCVPLLYESRTVTPCHPPGCAYR